MPPPEDRPELLGRDLVHVGVTRKALHIEGDPLLCAARWSSTTYGIPVSRTWP